MLILLDKERHLKERSFILSKPLEFFNDFNLALVPLNFWNNWTPEARKISDTYYLWWTKISIDIFTGR